MKTPEQIAAEVRRTYFATLDGSAASKFDAAVLDAIDADRAQLTIAIQDSQPIPGIRAYRLATVDEVLNAWHAFRGPNESVFIDAWNAYTAGEDFACPEAADGLHQVSDGSCDLCGDKNREDPNA